MELREEVDADVATMNSGSEESAKISKHICVIPEVTDLSYKLQSG